MLADRGADKVRLQCEGCGAHALMKSGDYSELLDHADGQMRCEVCGERAEFRPMRAPAREARALTAS
jgi:hypothetical protein